MWRRFIGILLVAALGGCAEGADLRQTSSAQLAQSYLEPIQFDSVADTAIQPVSIRMQPTGRRDYRLRIQQTIGLDTGLVEMDFVYSGSTRVTSRADGRSVFRLYVDRIEGRFADPKSGQRQPYSYTGEPLAVIETVHSVDNTLYEIAFPMLREVERLFKADENGAVALALLAQTTWPLYPIRSNRLAVGGALWPQTAQEMRDLFQKELGPALGRSKDMRALFDTLSPAEKTKFRTYDDFVREMSANFVAVFSGDGSTEMNMGGRITGARVWKGQDVLEAMGPIRFRGKVNLGPKPALFSLDGQHHVLVDPYSGLTVRTEFSAVGTIQAGSSRANITQRVSAQIAPVAGSQVVPAIPATPNFGSPPSRAASTDRGRGDLPADGTARSISDIYRTSIDSIFTVRTKIGTGTGFLVGPDIVLTNRHVVDDVGTGTLDLLQSGQVVATARVERSFDGAADLAVLRLSKPLTARPLILAGESPVIGSQVLIIGSPVGLEGSITGGMVSQLRMVGDAAYLQIDASINPGNSGGPVFDRLGRVVGITTARLEPRSPSGGPQIIGIGFALSSETVRSLIGEQRLSLLRVLP